MAITIEVTAPKRLGPTAWGRTKVGVIEYDEAEGLWIPYTNDGRKILGHYFNQNAATRAVRLVEQNRRRQYGKEVA